MFKKISWEYIAGFFDGEGCLSIKNRYKGIGYWTLGMTQKNIEVLETIQEFLGGGHIYKKSDCDCWSYELYKQQHVRSILEKLLPYLIVKYDKALEVIQYIRKHETGLRKPRGEI